MCDLSVGLAAWYAHDNKPGAKHPILVLFGCSGGRHICIRLSNDESSGMVEPVLAR